MEELLSATDSENKLRGGLGEISKLTQQLLAAQSSYFPSSLPHPAVLSLFP